MALDQRNMYFSVANTDISTSNHGNIWLYEIYVRFSLIECHCTRVNKDIVRESASKRRSRYLKKNK